MNVRILDLDGSVAEQPALRTRAVQIIPLRDWGPRLRLACSWRAFTQFETHLDRQLMSTRPSITFLGSGDFHHLSLALLRRLTIPFNLVVIDNHPDWMRGVPLLHCGTWLAHAARLPLVRRIVHLGGDVDFDNGFHWLAPWSELLEGKIVVIPARRRFTRGRWAQIHHQPLRLPGQQSFHPGHLLALLKIRLAELADQPLYVTVDRDVLRAEDAAVNWDSGHLTKNELTQLLEVITSFSGQLLGMDVVGDWSPVRTNGLLRRVLHWIEHPRQRLDTFGAQQLNEQLNLKLIELLHQPRLRRQTLPVT